MKHYCHMTVTMYSRLSGYYDRIVEKYVTLKYLGQHDGVNRKPANFLTLEYVHL